MVCIARSLLALAALVAAGPGTSGGASFGAIGALAAPSAQHAQQVFAADDASAASKLAKGSAEAFHETYHNYEDIQEYLHGLAAQHPDLASVISLGTTWENRSISALQLSAPRQGDESAAHSLLARLRRAGRALLRGSLSSGESGASAKPGLLIVAESHAREWVSGASALYFADKMLSLAAAHAASMPAAGAAAAPPSASASRFARNQRGRKHRRGKKGAKHDHAQPLTPAEAHGLLEAFTVTVVPLANPDGYAYTWDTKSGNRLWRKNRQPAADGASGCVGIDVNHNWDFAFTPDPSPSARCSESFAGSSAFEAYETRALSDFLFDPAHNVRAFVDLHSYGQHVMYPFATSCEEALPDEEDLAEVALGSAKALKHLHKSSFSTGRICDLLFTNWGTSIDWAYRVAGVKWSFAVELRDVGTYGFLLPPAQIVPSGEELTSLLSYMMQFIEKKK